MNYEFLKHYVNVNNNKVILSYSFYFIIKCCINIQIFSLFFPRKTPFYSPKTFVYQGKVLICLGKVFVDVGKVFVDEGKVFVDERKVFVDERKVFDLFWSMFIG